MDFRPEDAIAAAERLINPAGRGGPAVAASQPSPPAAGVVRQLGPEDPPPFDRPVVRSPRHRVLAIALLLVFLAPFVATVIATIER